MRILFLQRYVPLLLLSTLFLPACSRKKEAMERIAAASDAFEPYRAEAYALNDSLKYGNQFMVRCSEKMLEDSSLRQALSKRVQRPMDSLIHLVLMGLDTGKALETGFHKYLSLCQKQLTVLEALELGLNNGKVSPQQVFSTSDSVQAAADSVRAGCRRFRLAYMPLYYKRLNACPEYDFNLSYAIKRYNTGHRD